MNPERTKEMIEQMYAAGLKDEAKKLELSLRKHHPDEKVASAQTEEELAKFITQDKDMLILKDAIRKLAMIDYPVLIRGETGTGKEILARALHGSRLGPFETVNCAAIPEQLLESILFGHTKGSFTDAKEDKIGLFQHCYKGTLFLDEIGEMPMGLQSKLLRVLQEKRIRKVGDNKEIPVDVRIVTATNKNVKDERIFREDLYWRLCVFELNTKPLRERLHDIPLIIRHLDPSNKVPSNLMNPVIQEIWESNIVVEENDKENASKLMLLLHRKSNFLRGNVRELDCYVRRYEVWGKI